MREFRKLDPDTPVTLITADSGVSGTAEPV